MNTTRNFPTLSNVRLSQLEAGERALKGEEEEAAKLFFLSQGVTFQVSEIELKLKDKDFSRQNLRENKDSFSPASGVDAEVQAKVCSRRK